MTRPPIMLALLLVVSPPAAQQKMLPEMERLDVQFSCDDDGVCSLYAKDLNAIVELAQRGVTCR